jgi:hypothetical protein
VTPASSERVTQDSSRATPAGSTFRVPAGWTVTTKSSMVILDPPEPDSHIAIVDVKADGADAAVAAAWAAYKPDFKRPLKIALPQAAREGWEERRAFQYETSPNERAVLAAYASRAVDAWTGRPHRRDRAIVVGPASTGVSMRRSAGAVSDTTRFASLPGSHRNPNWTDRHACFYECVAAVALLARAPRSTLPR